MKKKVNVIILMVVSPMITLQQPCYAGKEKNQTPLPQEIINPSSQEPLKQNNNPKQPHVTASKDEKKNKKYETFKKYLKIGAKIGAGLGVAATGIYLSKNILNSKSKDATITKLLTSKSWREVQPLSSRYIRNVLYKNNKPMQDDFKKTLALLMKGGSLNCYFPFGCTGKSSREIDNRILLPLSEQEVKYLQSFVDKLFQDDAKFLVDNNKKEAQWKRFLAYKKADRSMFYDFERKARTSLDLHDKSIERYTSRKYNKEVIDKAFEASLKNDEAKEAFKILTIIFVDKDRSRFATINPDNFPCIARKIKEPDDESYYV